MAKLGKLGKLGIVTYLGYRHPVKPQRYIFNKPQRKVRISPARCFATALFPRKVHISAGLTSASSV